MLTFWGRVNARYLGLPIYFDGSDIIISARRHVASRASTATPAFRTPVHTPLELLPTSLPRYPPTYSTMAHNNSTNPIPLLEDASLAADVPLRKRSSNPTLLSSGGSSAPSLIHKRLKTNEEGNYAPTGSALYAEKKPPAEDDANTSDGGEIKSKSGSKTVATQAITGDTPILAMKAEVNGSSFQLFAQISPHGPYVPLSDVEIDSLKEKGYTRAISAVLAGALKTTGGTYRRCVPPRIDRSLPTSLKPLGSVHTTGDIDVSPLDALTNMLHDAVPRFYNESLAETLRSFRDESDEIIDMKSLSRVVNNDREKGRLEFRKPRKLECGNNFGNVSPLLRQEAVLDLASKGHMLIVDLYSKRHSGALGKYIGVANGKVYDNDEATGGIYDLREYVQHEWDGVCRVRIVVPM